MNRRSTRNALLGLWTVMLGACAHLPLQEREVVVPLDRLTEAVTRRIGDERTILEVFRVRVGDPRLSADPVVQRLRADFAISLTHPFSARPVTGRAALSGALGFDAETRSVLLIEPRIDRIDLDAVPSSLRDVAARLANALGRELLGSVTLVTLRDKDLTAMGRAYRVAGFEVVEQGVRIRLKAAD